MILSDIKLRAFRDSDKVRLAELCNNRKLWDNFRDFIPFPYSVKDAEGFIEFCRKEEPQQTFAIERNNELTGTIGLVLQKDIYRFAAEIGYWIGEPYWNQGIATQAVNKIVDYGFDQLNLVRIYTGVFDYNKASQRVLGKAGFTLECVFEKSVCKNGVICNEYRYAKINPDFKLPSEK